MDTIEKYRQIICDVLLPIAQSPYANTDLMSEAVFDRDRDHYLIMAAGWEGGDKRVHFCLVHIDIIGGKVWIQKDNTEYGVGYELEEAGIPKSDIVPAFHPVSVRPHTGYAVA